MLAVTEARKAVLLVSRLPQAADGRTYQLWVVTGPAPQPASTFSGGGAQSLVALNGSVPPGAQVAMSLEPAGGSTTVTGPLLFGTGTT